MSNATDATATQAPLDAETLRRQQVQSKLLMASFGEIVSVLMRTKQHRGMTLEQLEWLVVPAVMNNQFMLVEARAKSAGFVSPVGVILWALVSPEVDKRLTETVAEPMRLAPDEWKCGDIPWIIEASGQAQAVQAMVQRLQTQVFKGKSVKVRAAGEDGKPAVRFLAAPKPSVVSASPPKSS